jgi:uncharacterized membrane protein YcfT
MMSLTPVLPAEPLSAEPPTPSRIAWPDVAKAIAILFVVFTHARTELAFVGVESGAITYFFGLVSSMFMPLFFFVSGLFALSAVKRSWPELWNRRLLALAWLFLVWQPLVFAYKTVETLWLPNQPESNELGQVLRFVVSPVRPNGELWFLWVLILFYVILKASSRLPERLQLLLAAAASFAWLSFSTDVFTASQVRAFGNGWQGLPTHYFFFLVGALHGRRVLALMARPKPLILITTITVWVGAYALLREAGNLDLAGVQFGLRILGVAAGVSAAGLLSSSRGLLWIGQRTLPIYVSHISVIVLATTLLYELGATPAGPIVSAVLIVAIGALALAFALGLYFVLSRGKGRYLYEPPPRVERAMTPR